ncbi:DEKNAAC104989 [Brettanomyces naardenensis]|uniref:DEKNAAC104989 n=1 Tax=Brettanomyces naardenensis TaxID=13370 RepID=A0A448YS40_BRENA|nr:DEKNAAC104989 [Brettanomyces naardenensis]
MKASVLHPAQSPVSSSCSSDAIASAPEGTFQYDPLLEPRRRRRNHKAKKLPWKKLLWVKQDYDDNYTDRSFLSQLKRNSTVVSYSYWKLFQDFSLIGLHISIILLVILVFYGIYMLDWNPVRQTVVSSTLTVIGFIIYVVTLKIRRNRELINLQRRKIEQLASRRARKSQSRSSSPYPGTTQVRPATVHLDLEQYLTEPSAPDLFGAFKSSMLILLNLLTFSPVLKSLTNSSASDSIWAISAWLCLLNLLFNDYVIDFPQKQRFPEVGISGSSQVAEQKTTSSSNLSKNIALSNAIVLASRLNSNLSAFCFILFSVEVCGLFPIFNNFTRRCQFWQFHWIQVAGIVFGVDYAVYKIFGPGWVACWLSLHLLIVVAGPLYFIALQKYKDELQGPWDPAHPILKSA